MMAEKQDRGLLRVDGNECKGCGLCIVACPPKLIYLNERLNHYGYRTATYAGSGCTGCGICFMACPEPGAITVLRLRANPFGKKQVIDDSLQPDVEGAMACASN